MSILTLLPHSFDDCSFAVSLKTSKCKPFNFVFLFQDYLIILNILHFHMNLRIIFSISVKNSAVSLRIALATLYRLRGVCMNTGCLSIILDFLNFQLYFAVAWVRRNKESLDEGKIGEWKSWLKTQHSKNKDHGIQSHHFMANRYGKVETDRFSFLGLQNHCGWWLQSWN